LIGSSRKPMKIIGRYRLSRPILACLFGLVLCLPSSLRADKNPRPSVKVGVILGLSGAMAPAAQEMRRGLELALSEPDTWPMQLIYEDDQGMEQKFAVTALTKLLTADKVTVVLNWVNTTMPSLAPLSTRYRVPIIEFWDHNQGMLKLGPYVFCSGTSTELSGERSSRFMLETHRIRKAALIFLQDPWSELIGGVFKRAYSAGGGQVVYEARIDPDEHDLKAILLRAKRAGAEGIFAPIFLGSLYALVRQGRELGFGGKIFTGDGFLESDIKLLGEAAEGVYSSQTIIADEGFGRRYAARYGGVPGVVGLGYAGLAYDAIKILSKVFGEISAGGGKIDPESVRAALAPLRFAGVSGMAVLSGKAEKVEDMVVIKNGRFERVPQN
jgi:branched-chain amino acid transport system substrate-binding protein